MTAIVTRTDPDLPKCGELPRGGELAWWARRRLLRLATDRRTQRNYRVRELDGIDRSEFAGRCFALDKLDPGSDPEADAYVILVADRGEGWDSCECKGFLRHGHCSHLGGLRVVLAKGWWDLPAHPCATPEYDRFTAAVDAGAPDPDPEPRPARVCVICHNPVAPDAADRSGLAHGDCAAQELADLAAGDEAAAEFEQGRGWYKPGHDGNDPAGTMPF